jgi:hypothetical protein
MSYKRVLYMPYYPNWKRTPAQTRFSLGSNPR